MNEIKQLEESILSRISPAIMIKDDNGKLVSQHDYIKEKFKLIRDKIIAHYKCYGYEKQHYLTEILCKAFDIKEKELELK